MCAQSLASVGLIMDIVGILVLYFVAIEPGAWRSKPPSLRERVGKWGGRCGIGLATIGFGLQIWAQWPERLPPWLCQWPPWL